MSDGDGELRPNPSPSPTSEVGSQRANAASAPLSSDQGATEQNWRMMFEMQNENMKALIAALKQPGPSAGYKITLPEFDPEKPDADARAWCATADVCFADKPLEGGQLVVVISKALKGVASTWLAQISYAGMTWTQFKEMFVARFVSVETSAATLINLNNNKPKDGETLASYGSRLITSLLNNWKGKTVEQIAVSTVLAHMSQFDSKLHRLAYTTEIGTRNRFQQELQAFSFLKRKANSSLDQKIAPEFKRAKFSTLPPVKCFHCGKIGHKQSECFHRGKEVQSKKWTNPAVPTTRSGPQQQPTTSGKIICFKCNEPGHIASRCPAAQGASRGGSGGGPNAERRVNVCVVEAPTGNLNHKE